METLLEPLTREVRVEKHGVTHDVPRAARLAVTWFFLVNGALFGTWVSRIPAIQSERGLSHGVLGLALLSIALGALVAMPLAGQLMGRIGSHRITQGCALIYAVLLPVLAIVPGFGLWVVALFAFGIGHGALDVAMNAQAVEVENRYRRPIMSSFHALFSAGGLIGAAMGGLAAAVGLAPLGHFLLVSAVLLSLTIGLACPHLIDDRRPVHLNAKVNRGFSMPKPALLAIGAVAFCAMMGEGAMADWSGVFLRHTLQTSEGVAAAGYAAFSITMALTRFIGDGLATKLGSRRLVRISGILATIGMAITLLSPNAVGAMIGFACVGAGFATVVPMAFSAAGRTPGVSAGVALATATTVGYLGFLLGPPLIGFVAEWIGLRGALCVILTTSALIVVLASVVRGGAPHGKR